MDSTCLHGDDTKNLITVTNNSMNIWLGQVKLFGREKHKEKPVTLSIYSHTSLLCRNVEPAPPAAHHVSVVLCQCWIFLLCIFTFCE